MLEMTSYISGYVFCASKVYFRNEVVRNITGRTEVMK